MLDEALYPRQRKKADQTNNGPVPLPYCDGIFATYGSIMLAVFTYSIISYERSSLNLPTCSQKNISRRKEGIWGTIKPFILFILLNL